MSARVRYDERGIVLIMAMVVMAILFVVASAFIVVIRQESVASQHSLKTEQARLAARAGISHAIRQIGERLQRVRNRCGTRWGVRV